MRAWIFLLLVTALIFAACPTHAQTPASPPRPALGSTPAPGVADTMRFHLLDGSIITGRPTVKELVVETSYGTLKIPLTELRGFRPGLDSHPDIAADLTTQVQKLGAVDAKERDAAQEALQKLGPAYRGEIEKFAEDTDFERKTRVQAILEHYDAMDQEALDQGDDAPERVIAADTIDALAFRATGRIATRSFDIASAYGNLTLRIADIHKAERDLVQAREALRRLFQVDATHLVPSRMKATAIRLRRGDRVTVTASGTINLTPWGNEATVGPEGSSNFGGWFVPNQIPHGALVGRVGNGEPFKIGAKTTFVADRAGALELGVAIMPNYARQQMPGQFDVRLVVKPAE